MKKLYSFLSLPLLMLLLPFSAIAQSMGATVIQGGNSSNVAAVNASSDLEVEIRAGATAITATGTSLNTNCTGGCAAPSDNTTGSTALGALNATITVPLNGEKGVAFQLQSSGTGVYTVTPQCSYDGGTIYNTNGYIQDPVTGVVSLTATIASAQATTDYPVMCPQGSSHAQMKVTLYTSGTANWLARATTLTWPGLAWGVVTTAAPSYTTGLINALSLDTSGNLRVLSSPTGTGNINIAQVNGSAVTTSATGQMKVGIVGNTGVALDAATGAAPPANAFLMAGLGSGATGGFLTGVAISDTAVAVNISTATTTRIVTGVSGRQVRIGAWHLVVNGADNVAWIEGTGATCGTGTAGMAGGTTAASGYNFAANGGIAQGSGIGTVLSTITSGDSVCLITSAATQVSGQVDYTIY